MQDQEQPEVGPFGVWDDGAVEVLGSARPGTSGLLDEQTALRPRTPIPDADRRGLLARLLGSDPAADPSDPDRAACRQAVPGGRRIAVISRKGGVGKTTATLMIGHTLAALRPDRVLAIDGNADAGTLGHRVERQTSATVLDALERIDQLRGYPDARRLTSQAASGLEVLAAPDDPHQARAIAGADYARVLHGMHLHYTVVLCDTGTGVLDDATTGILDAVDQIVLLSGLGLDTARAAGMTLDWLDANGRGALVRDAVVVINAITEAGRVDVGVIADHFLPRVRAVHLVPYDRHLEAGSVTDPGALAAPAQQAWLQVTASVADGFGLPSPRDAPRSRS